MFGSLLIALSLVSDAPRPGHNPEDLATYAEARAALGRGDAPSQIRLALWREAHGLRAGSEKVRSSNAGAFKVLEGVTDRNLGENPEPWRKWWTEV